VVTLLLDEAALVLAVIAVGIAVRKWHAVRDRRLLLSVMLNALKERKALWVGILTAVFYLAIFMILGGQGGRVHLLFGRVIWNTSPRDMLAGILLALLVMLSMALFIYGVQVMGARWSGRQGGMGIIGSVLALLAAFCP
jgi:protein-S-isoprenylcysteine O-methyltransferase Ste14